MKEIQDKLEQEMQEKQRLKKEKEIQMEKKLKEMEEKL